MSCSLKHLDGGKKRRVTRKSRPTRKSNGYNKRKGHGKSKCKSRKRRSLLNRIFGL